MVSKPVTFPFLLSIFLGPSSLKNITPSSSDSSISHTSAGILSFNAKSLVSRQTTLTSFVPIRSATLAQSIATFPPPMTINFSPNSGVFIPFFASFRKVNPSKTPETLEPSTSKTAGS